MRVAVSGVGGFVGVHLARELVEHGHEVIGLGLGAVPPAAEELLATYVDADLASAWPDVGVDGVDGVVHLAGLSAVGPSFDDPQGYLEGNSAPLTRLAERLLAAGRAGERSPRLVVISTGAVYAPGVGLDESSPTQATSPYGVSKLLVELQCSYYRRRGLDVVVMRPFNHLGPGQARGFLLPDLIAGVNCGELVVGNLDTRRDYTDVRDVARAYRLAIEAESVGVPVLNVCSGRSVSGREMLDLVAQVMGIATPDVRVDRTRLRPEDPAEIRGDASLTRRSLGWVPEIDLARTVRDAIADLRL